MFAIIWIYNIYILVSLPLYYGLIGGVPAQKKPKKNLAQESEK